VGAPDAKELGGVGEHTFSRLMDNQFGESNT
jgi:hypothetical protein